MIAADTNVLVRLVTDDEPRQTAQARQLFETETIFLAKTVLLETEWVLRRLYRLDPLPVARAASRFSAQSSSSLCSRAAASPRKTTAII